MISGCYMARKCEVSGKSRQHGHRVSHANNKTKHVFSANLQSRRVYIASEKRYVRIKVSTRILRTFDKLGVEGTFKKYGLSLADVLA